MIDAVSELDVFPQVIFVNDPLEIVEDLWTLGVVLAPDVRLPGELVAYGRNVAGASSSFSR
jgi:hypothetical protein